MKVVSVLLLPLDSDVQQDSQYSPVSGESARIHSLDPQGEEERGGGGDTLG